MAIVILVSAFCICNVLLLRPSASSESEVQVSEPAASVSVKLYTAYCNLHEAMLLQRRLHRKWASTQHEFIEIQKIILN